MKSVIIISVIFLSFSVQAQFGLQSLVSAPNFIGDLIKPLLSPLLQPNTRRRFEREYKLEVHRSDEPPRLKDSSAIIFPGQNDVRDKNKNVFSTSNDKNKVQGLTSTVRPKSTLNKTDKPSLNNRFGSNYVLLPIGTLGASQQPAAGGGIQNYQSAGLGVVSPITNPTYTSQNQLSSYLQQPQGQVSQYPVYSQPAQTIETQYVTVPNTGYNPVFMTSQPTGQNYQQVLLPPNSGSQATYYTLVNPNQNVQKQSPLYYVVNPGSQSQPAASMSYSYIPAQRSYGSTPPGYALLAQREPDDGGAKEGRPTTDKNTRSNI